jgi:hypothetical protein
MIESPDAAKNTPQCGTARLRRELGMPLTHPS